MVQESFLHQGCPECVWRVGVAPAASTSSQIPSSLRLAASTCVSVGSCDVSLVRPHPCLTRVDLLHVTSRHSPWVSTPRVRYYSHLEMI